MSRFGYLRDRLFWISLTTYAINRLLIRPHFGPSLNAHSHWLWEFSHSHLDDCLLIPAALPVVLWLQRLIGLRNHDQPPGWGEMFGHLAIWSVMCKFVGPHWLHIGVADPWDLVAFAMGGIAACLWWHRPTTTPATQPVPARP